MIGSYSNLRLSQASNADLGSFFSGNLGKIKTEQKKAKILAGCLPVSWPFFLADN
jgi:hypothetical protein